jgi:hypothetical protein
LFGFPAKIIIPSKLRFASWPEIDFKKAMLTLPPERIPIDGGKYSHRGSKYTFHIILCLPNPIWTLKLNPRLVPQ